MQESLFVIPKSFDEGQLSEAWDSIGDPEVVYVASDLRDDTVLSEDEAVAILANYGQVRRYLHNKALGRGFSRPQHGKGGGRGYVRGDAE